MHKSNHHRVVPVEEWTRRETTEAVEPKGRASSQRNVAWRGMGGLKFGDLEMLATESGENAKMKKNGIGAGEL